MRRDLLIGIIGGVVGTVFSTFVALAWTGPTQAPPNGNVSAPLNVGTVDQIKNANLGINGLAVFGNTILQASSYLNWGSTAGTNGYGIRDNAGTLEFKNSSGSWANLNTTVQSSLTINGITTNGLGQVSQVKFADGTTQTTANNSVTGITTNSSGVTQITFFNGTTQTTAAPSSSGFTSCTQVSVSNGSGNTANASCAAGYTMTGGGCTSGAGFVITTSYPASATTWRCTVNNNAGLPISYAICCH